VVVHKGLRSVPLIAAELAVFSHTPLPVILGWSLQELFFWHSEVSELAGA
jgi:hypothetical protein